MQIYVAILFNKTINGVHRGVFVLAREHLSDYCGECVLFFRTRSSIYDN